MTESPKPKSSRGWRIVRRILIVLAVLATLIAVFVTEEDWRGKHAWERYKREMEAKGETFDWQTFVPAVPDDQNLFKAPIFDGLADGHFNPKTAQWEFNPRTAKSLDVSVYGEDNSATWPNIGNWVKGRITDLASWQQYYRALAAKTNQFAVPPQPQTPAADVLLALSKDNSAIEELREAARRPDSRIPLDYDQGMEITSGELLQYLVFLKRSVQLLQLRSIAELQKGESDKALDDIQLIFRLNDSMRNQPFLISHLVRIAILSMAMQPVWEGLVQHRWTDKQLALLGDALAKMDFLQDYEFAIRGEAAFAIVSLENRRLTRQFSILEQDDKGGYKVMTDHFYLTPSAYFYQSEMAHARMSQQFALTLVDTNRRIVSPEISRRAQDEIKSQMKHFAPYRYEALMTAQVLIPAARKFAIAQTDVDLARVACALERYRLAKGQYPETLDALAPQFIESQPHDVINGQPLIYRLTPDGKFLLYSLGWNETDDGGKVAFTKNGNVDYLQGDWVWPSVKQ